MTRLENHSCDIFTNRTLTQTRKWWNVFFWNWIRSGRNSVYYFSCKCFFYFVFVYKNLLLLLAVFPISRVSLASLPCIIRSKTCCDPALPFLLGFPSRWQPWQIYDLNLVKTTGGRPRVGITWGGVRPLSTSNSKRLHSCVLDLSGIYSRSSAENIQSSGSFWS